MKNNMPKDRLISVAAASTDELICIRFLFFCYKENKIIFFVCVYVRAWRGVCVCAHEQEYSGERNQTSG